MKMEIPLYKALKSINVDDETASRAVEAIEEYIDMTVLNANNDVIEKIKKTQDLLAYKIDLLKWMLGFISILIIICVVLLLI